ncbi:MAG: hypothetical protein LBH37_01105 [Oscillospiraceae bacterium]|nr:hypothetical protein [Oscillospiraceae bacterium]
MFILKSEAQPRFSAFIGQDASYVASSYSPVKVHARRVGKVSNSEQRKLVPMKEYELLKEQNKSLQQQNSLL